MAFPSRETLKVNGFAAHHLRFAKSSKLDMKLRIVKLISAMIILVRPINKNSSGIGSIRHRTSGLTMKKSG